MPPKKDDSESSSSSYTSSESESESGSGSTSGSTSGSASAPGSSSSTSSNLDNSDPTSLSLKDENKGSPKPQNKGKPPGIEMEAIQSKSSKSSSESESKSKSSAETSSTEESNSSSSKGKKEKEVKIEVKVEEPKKEEPNDNVENQYYPISINDPEKNSKQPFPPNVTRTTKYTAASFIFKVLYEQYKKITNVYFLIVVIISCIPQVSPITPVTSILPVVFVLAVSIIREAIEDLRRYREDRAVNNIMYEILVGDEFVKIKSRDIKVGNIIRLTENQRIPADVLALKTSLPDGLVYIETSQLDGETNLKSYNALPKTFDLSVDQIKNLRGDVTSEKPTYKFSSYQARVKFEDGTVVGVNEKALLLQGAKIKNTKEVYGTVIFTGKDTKLSKNQRKSPYKTPRSEKTMNMFVISVFFFKIILCVIAAVLATETERDGEDCWYLLGPDGETDPSLNGLKMFFSYFALLSYIIPMSMVVSLEVVRFVQGIFIEWDDNMKYPLEDDFGEIEYKGAIAKSSSLNDELSLVKYVFSDKTGTLTQNLMEFKSCTIRGKYYDTPMTGQLLSTIEELKTSDDEKEREHATDILEFLYCVGLCHTVVPERQDNGKIVFQAQSPDEVALCQVAESNCYLFTDRTQGTVTLEGPRGEERFNVEALIEFSSDRRRMSVIIKNADARITLYTKGADNVMLKLVKHESDEDKRVYKKTQEDIKRFSTEGLRSLIIAKRDIPDAEYAAWREKYDIASSVIGDRDEQIKKVFESIEHDMHLLGCTAVEDKLQDEVPETIHTLLRAGIQVWMITGDKQETAVNIGRSCKLVAPDAKLLIIDSISEETAEKILSGHIRTAEAEKSVDTALVINGASTHVAVEQRPDLFMALVSKVRSVICCQVTPLQKAQIVKCVKDNTPHVCLSIGDGANDVTMIQTADIGVGIFGREGTQAARAADYAIRQFKDLRRLVMIHGRYSMVRNSLLIKVSFFKNIAVFITQFFFAFFSKFSGQTIIEDWFMTFFNIFMSSVPPICIGLFEKDAREETIKKYPEVHYDVPSGYMFNCWKLIIWLIYGIYAAAVNFFVPFAFIAPSKGIISKGGMTADNWILSSYVMSGAIATITTVMSLFTKYWTWVSVIGTLFGVVFWFVYWLIETTMDWTLLYGTLLIVIEQPSYWLSLLSSVVISIIPAYIYLYIKYHFFPETWVVLEENKKLKEKEEKKKKGKI